MPIFITILPCTLLISQKNKSLKMLRMTGNKTGNKRCHATAQNKGNLHLNESTFAIILKNNRKICAINEETRVHMAQMLVVNKTLRELHLGKHDMTDTGIVIREMISSVFFNCNRITRDGAKCLSEVLKQNPTLEILDLSSNRIEDDSAVYLSEDIKLPHSKCIALFTHETISFVCNQSEFLSHTFSYILGNKLEEPVCMAFSQLISSGRLLEEHTDVSPYEVDDHVFLAEVSHGLCRHYYWTSRYGEYGDSSNSALALMASGSLALQIHPDSHS
uniref:Leucine rich repeat containing 34 n=2 Tax=Cyprinus carpio TaxID=7962 RepID=A0A9J7XII8_CYPCA